MKRHADFDIIQVEEDRVFIVDMDCGGPSVTNDAEYVAETVSRFYPHSRIIYKDSTGQWDEIVITDSKGNIAFRTYIEHVPKGY